MSAETLPYDIEPKRATYNIPYPNVDSLIVFNTKKEFEARIASSNLIEANKVQFKYSKAYNRSCTFKRCQFFIEGDTENLIKQISFKGCEFNSCFLGSVSFKGCRFESCKFENCDFSNSIFENCSFDKCTFKNCSAYHPDFTSTEINAKSFLEGIVFLESNYPLVTPQLNSDFVYMKLNLAKKIYNSNDSVGNHYLSDVALYELKKNELEYQVLTLKQDFKERKYLKAIRDSFFSFFKYSNLKVTNGGTSFLKLMLFSSSLILIFNLYFVNSDITDSNYTYPESTNLILNYFQWLPRTASIFLAYGYTSFKTANGFDFFIINTCVILGIIAYAMVISILVRKIYK